VRYMDSTAPNTCLKPVTTVTGHQPHRTTGETPRHTACAAAGQLQSLHPLCLRHTLNCKALALADTVLGPGKDTPCTIHISL
jgi:hypothetical protein